MILLDTSGILAAMFEDQKQHEACARVLREAEGDRIISPFVLAEADYLIQKFGGWQAELLFLHEVSRSAYFIAPFDEHDLIEATDIVRLYADMKVGLADASIVVLSNRYDCRDVLTLDLRHFRAFRPKPRRTFRILPADHITPAVR